MLDLGGADAVGKGAERAVGGSVRVATDHGHARQSGALLRADHMNDALAQIIHLEFENAKFIAVLIQGHHLNT